MTSPLRRGLSHQAHLRSLGEGARRALGVVYTPAALADFVLGQAAAGRPEAFDRPFLDPACGAGAFLTAAVRHTQRA